MLDTFIRILIENDGVVKIVGHDMNQGDMETLLKHPDTIIATDSRAIRFDSAAANRGNALFFWPNSSIRECLPTTAFTASDRWLESAVFIVS